MFADTENIFEFIRNMPSSVCILMVIPILMFTAPAYGSHEFPVFRVQQFDLNGVKYGSRAAALNLEARSILADNLIRRCAVVRGIDANIEIINKAINDGLSGLLILIPTDLNSMPIEAQKSLRQLEIDLLETQVPIPVYFAHETEKLKNLYEEITNTASGYAAPSALKAMTSVAVANSFHFVTDGGESKPLNDFPIISLTGKLTGQGLEDQLPTVVVTTHYDSFGIVPKLSKGLDSTGSGVVAFLELARMFSKLYEKRTIQPKYNMLFLLAGGGKFNYQGTKKWIEDNVESSEFSLLAEADYVICIDAIGQGAELNLHVSKPPKQGTQAYALVQDLQEVIKEQFPGSNFNVVHKKVNLAEEMLAWEHERFSLRRLPAGTISHHDKPNHRGSIFDTEVETTVMKRNIKVLAEGLSRHIFNLSGKGYSNRLEVFSGDLDIDSDHVDSWVSHLSNEPRSQQLITKEHRLLTSFEETMGQYLKDVRRVASKADKKDPEFVFYDVYDGKMNVYSVKPALFDLFLAIGIAGYLGIVYLFFENFHRLTDMIPKSVSNGKVH